MHKRAFMVFCLLCAAGTALAQAYRWTDENGVVHFSDRPHPGAEQIQLPSYTRLSAKARKPSVANEIPGNPRSIQNNSNFVKKRNFSPESVRKKMVKGLYNKQVPVVINYSLNSSREEGQITPYSMNPRRTQSNLRG